MSSSSKPSWDILARVPSDRLAMLHTLFFAFQNDIILVEVQETGETLTLGQIESINTKSQV